MAHSTPHLAARVPVVMLGVPLPPMSPEYAALGMYAAKIVLYGLMVEDSVGKIGHSREIACANDIKLAGCLLTEGAEEGTEKGTNDIKNGRSACCSIRARRRARRRARKRAPHMR